jgi:hypothetical protein
MKPDQTNPFQGGQTRRNFIKRTAAATTFVAIANVLRMPAHGQINTDRVALVWPHYLDEPIDLNTRLDAKGCHDAGGHPVPLEAAWAINNHGQILVTGRNEFSGPATLRLTPVSEC